MPSDVPAADVERTIDSILRGDAPSAVLLYAGDDWLVRVVGVKSSQGARPDGLREDVEGDLGFSFAVADADLELNAPLLPADQREAGHRILWTAATDDFIDYSHFGSIDIAKVPAGDTLAIRFSSSYKAGGVVGELRTALGR